ncbi:hypothetical protein C7R91_21735 [Brevibacillus formosus]|nr:hypothetical protein C7R91_21735 [Brevibacillus formosus]
MYFERYSNLGLIIAVNEDKLDLTSEGITLKRKIDYKEVLNKSVKDYIRAAHYLGLLCSKMELANIFRVLGVTVT